MKQKTMLLALLVLLALALPLTAGAESSGSCGDNVTWTLDDSGLLTISGTGPMDNYGWYGSPWYGSRASITTVQIENGVTGIGTHAFSSCFNLTDVTIGNNVTSIGNFAFYLCTGVTSVTIPESVLSIGNHAFNGCSSLTGVVLPNSLTSLGYRVFDNCTRLTTINIPAGLTRIYDQTFFEGSRLSSIQVSPENQNYCDVDGVLFDKNMTRIIRYPSGKTGGAYQIPDGIARIDSYAFYGCATLTSITIPESVTYISDSAFSDCDNLAGIHVSPDNQKYCDVDGILFTKNMTSIEHYPNAKSGSVYQIPDGVTRIGSSAFEGCANLTGIHIPESVTYIGSNAFYRCTSLNNVTIPQRVTEIGNFTFQNCTNLTTVTIPENVTSIGYNAFDGCSSLTDVNYTGSGEEWAAISIDAGNDDLTNAELHSNYGAVEPEVIASGSCGDKVTWTLYDNGLLTISGTGAMDDFDWMDSPWYDNWGIIATIQIENGVTSIGDNAFIGCTSLTSVTIPESVASIGYNAFCYCTSLPDVTIPEGVTSIGDTAFQSCRGLTSVTIPESVTSIGEYAFSNCSSLASIQVESGNKTYASAEGVLFNKAQTTLIACPAGKTGTYAVPSGVTSIEDSAFNRCASLTGVTIPDSVASIGDYAFSNCSSLASIQVESGSTTYTSADGVLFDKARTTLITYPGGKAGAYVIPSGVTGIRYGAFSDCSGLTSVTIPDSVASIEYGAFSECSSLTDVYYTGSSEEWAAISIESGNDDLTNAEIHYHTTLIASGSCGANVTWMLDSSGLLTISGTGAMDDYLWYGNPWYSSSEYITTVRIKNGVTSIGSHAFSGCSSMTGVTIPDSVTSMGSHAFYDCTSLTDVTIPDSITSIGDCVFRDCTGLTSVTIPSGVTTIGYHAFESCSSLTGVTIPDSVTSFGYGAFSGCSGLTSVNIPDSVTSIGGEAFRSCRSLTSITIPESVTSIGDRAFSYCNGLTSVTIPASVTSMGVNPFSSCANLTSIQVDSGSTTYASVDGVLCNKAQTTLIACPGGKEGAYAIPFGVTGIAYGAFSGCTGLTGVTIPDSVTSIGYVAFYGCRSLTSVTIPSSVTSVGDMAFDECRGLTEVYYTGTIEQWAAISIGSGNSRLTGAEIHYNYRVITNILTLPASLTVIESEAFAGLDKVDAVSIPATVTSIADDAFDAGVVIIAPAESYAETWANDHGFTVNNP